MTSTKESYLVQFYLKLINKDMDREKISNLFNLREVVFEILE